MRGLIRTLGHLIVILIIVAAIVAILFAIPGSRYWLLREVPGAAVDLMAPASMCQLVRGAVSELDPKVVAGIINDKETREELIKLIEGVLQKDGIDAKATAKLVNEILDDPNLSNFVTELLPELKADAVADLVNQVVKSEGTITLVNDLISDLDPESLAKLLDGIVAAPGLVDLVNGLVSELEPTALADLVNQIVKDPDTIKLVNGLVSDLEPESLAKLLDGIVAAPGLVDLVNGLVSELEPTALASLMNELMIAPEGDEEGLLTRIIAEMNGENLAIFLEALAPVDSCIEFVYTLIDSITPTGAFADLINGIRPALDEYFFPYFWLKIEAEGTAIGALGIEFWEIPILGEIIKAIESILKINLWMQFTDIYFGEECPW